MSRLEYERLHHNLKLLDLVTIESILDNYLEIAAKDGNPLFRSWIIWRTKRFKAKRLDHST